jgi:SAF domain
MTRTMSPPATELGAPQPSRRRGSRLMMLGVLLAVIGGGLGWFAYTQATAGITVVAVARRVPYGATVAEADLRAVTVPAASTLRTVAWADHGAVVGRIAATDLLPDTILSPDAVGTGRLPRPGEAIVGVAVGPGHLPASGLAVHDTVLVVRADATVGPLRASVLAVGDPDTSGRRTVDLVVPESAAEALARAGGDDRTALVLVAGG